jgi:excinuclease ABC subunit A
LAAGRNGAGNGFNGHAGPQPTNIVAAADPDKKARGKFVPPEKKTGVPTARASKLGEAAVAPEPKKKAAAKKTAAKATKKKA